MHIVTLIRHGESEWNLANRFTGWTDVDLSEKGVREAQAAGATLKEHAYHFDCAYTSYLVRAIRTLHIVLRAMGLLWIPEYKHWELNERHYGGLQGYDKAEKAKEVGEEQVHIWRRSYDTPPPPLSVDNAMHPKNDIRYRNLAPEQLPATESLKDTVNRVIPFWDTVIKPNVLTGKQIVIAAHGNSLRALVKHLKNINDADIMDLNIPTGKPLIFELDDTAQSIKDYYL